MNRARRDDRSRLEVTIWFDPVCPFSWNTTRWLTAVAHKTGLPIDWQLMSLAVLNQGRELPPPQQARMRDSQHIGRLMAAIYRERGAAGLAAAYLAFGEFYFDRNRPVDDSLVAHVLTAAGARDTTAAAQSDASLDELVRHCHQAGQDALGETGGSPILRIDGHTFFGPVLTAVPAAEMATPLFDAVATLAATPQFSQLQRPRTAA
ncbi:DsbA family protein [Mycobacterium intracellulare]|jgi:2-hydroxychromene-2-carboxylate isomerase|uniref:mycothiol-dependent nitroreductase Rv2466c family protein n=1 Tax=Mycobacterium intracellulare TaxID=1767 RepID=UPI000C7C6460|nr:DsbA family protein [Mycobacterium intracellulare]